MPVDIVEMLWECTHCNSTVLGRYKECQNCGKTKSTKCREWLPDDVSHTSSSVVTDKQLHSKFVAGPDWKCRYCNSLEWRVDGTCANCGSSQDEEVSAETPSEPTPKETDNDPSPLDIPKQSVSPFLRLLVTLFVACIFMLPIYYLFRTVSHRATVTETHWTYNVNVEREQIVTHDGFTPSGGAINIRPIGMRTVRYESVLDHYDTVSYTYQEACGQTCTPVPRTCRTTPRTCKSNKNGSATCSGGDQICSGGGQSCSPKYCSKTGTRKEARYRQEPVNQMYYTWQQWDWIYNRSVQKKGIDVSPVMPDEIQINLGDHERQTSSLTMFVTFCNDDDHKCNNYTPDSMPQFSTLPVGSHHTIRVNTLGFITIVNEASSTSGSYLYPGYNHT